MHKNTTNKEEVSRLPDYHPTRQNLKLEAMRRLASVSRKRHTADRRDHYFDFKAGKLTEVGWYHDMIDAHTACHNQSNWLLSAVDLQNFDAFITQTLATENTSAIPAWYGMTYDDALVLIGHFATQEEAERKATMNDRWVLHEDALRNLQSEIRQALKISESSAG